MMSQDEESVTNSVTSRHSSVKSLKVQNTHWLKSFGCLLPLHTDLVCQTNGRSVASRLEFLKSVPTTKSSRDHEIMFAQWKSRFVLMDQHPAGAKVCFYPRFVHRRSH